MHQMRQKLVNSSINVFGKSNMSLGKMSEAESSEQKAKQQETQEIKEDNSSSTSFDIESNDQQLSLQEFRMNSIRMKSSKMLLDFMEAKQDADTFNQAYILGDKIGSGMHSNVHKCYLATDLTQSHAYAVKISLYDCDEKKQKLIEEFDLGN